MSDQLVDTRRKNKKAGQESAKKWLRTARIEMIIAVAGLDMQYGDPLDIDELAIEHREDCDFAYGFWKQVKSWTHHKLQQTRRSNAPERNVS